MERIRSVTRRALLCLSVTGLFGAGIHAAPAPPAAKVDLKPALGQGFAAYEKLLGAPLKKQKDEGGEYRTYKRAGFTRIALTLGNDGAEPPTLLDYVSEVQLGFPSKQVRSWKEALTLVGLPTEGISLTRDEGYFTLEGLPNGMEGAWIPNNPDVPGEHTLTLTPKKVGSAAAPARGRILATARS